MKILPFLSVAALVASPVIAEDSRKADSHEHGVGQLDIAFEGSKVSMELHAPGADIVGFEYEAESDEDLAAIEAAIKVLSSPLNLFGLPNAAECTVIEATAELEDEDSHEGEEHEEHDDHKDDDHAEHDDHKDDDHEDHGEKEGGHTEFHAEYLLECGNVSAVTEMAFAYFNAFPNAKELELQVVSDKGASAFEVERDEPSVDLSGLF